jgi:uncharacterized protein YehS (DUF1456 family)
MEKSAQTPNLKEVVMSFDRLKVEDYQRTYAWQREQIEEFLQDLKDCAPRDDSHFLGTLILQESGHKTANVVDGQQRLTTVFILVGALRDELRKMKTGVIKAESANKRDISVIDKALDFLCASDSLDDYRFESSRFLRKFMKTLVLAEPEFQKEIPAKDQKVTLDFRKAIIQIRNWVSSDLKEYPDEIDKLRRIDILLDTVLEKFIVLKVTTSNIGESLDIFLTLNNRGLPLGPSDLVRGEIMSVLSSGLSETDQVILHRRVLEEWGTIVNEVKEPETFLRHFLVSTSKTKVQKRKVVSEVSNRIFHSDFQEKQKNARDFWQQLQLGATTYGMIVSPRMGGDCQYFIELLEGLGKSHRIALLSVLGAELVDQERDELVRLIFVLAFRNVMAGLNAQKLEDFYQEQGYIFNSDRDFARLRDSMKLRANEIELNSLKYLTNEGDSGFVGRALLHAINRATTSGANQTRVSSSDCHVEHIAPQTEIEHWTEALFGSDENARKQYDAAISQIGNLTLLDSGLNSQAQRKSFEEKKGHYKLCSFWITRDLLDLPNWDFSSIQLRTKWLVEMFEIIWSVEKSDEKVKIFTDWLP